MSGTEIVRLILCTMGACCIAFIISIIAAYAIAMLSCAIVYSLNALAEMFRRKFWKGYAEDITEE